jgi:glycine/D-amino acid oxidase-like deaminating enzyme
MSARHDAAHLSPDPKQNLFYALGYGGNGVSYSAQAGRRMAQMIAGKKFDGQDLPIFTSPLPAHPFVSLRRLGQRVLYGWYHLREEAQ